MKEAINSLSLSVRPLVLVHKIRKKLERVIEVFELSPHSLLVMLKIVIWSLVNYINATNFLNKTFNE